MQHCLYCLFCWCYNPSALWISVVEWGEGPSPDNNYLERFSSHYNYFRIACGIDSTPTISVASGYWLNKTQIGLYGNDTLEYIDHWNCQA